MLLGENKFKESGGMQLFSLFALYYVGIVIGAVTIQLVLGSEPMSTVYGIRVAHIIQGVSLFLVPATIYGLLFADTRGDFLVKAPLSLRNLGLAILLIFAVQVFIESVNHYNNLITLPGSMKGLDDFFKQTKESGEKTLGLVLADKSINSLLINLFIIAVIPGIVEELFFRGCMQRSIARMGSNPHVAVWITAIIFSLLHFQLAGLFPRIFLGAILGYLYLWTRNIWAPIIVHIIHNGTIIFVNQMLLENDTYKKLSITDYSLSNVGLGATVSLVISIAIMYLIYRNRVTEVDDDQ